MNRSIQGSLYTNSGDTIPGFISLESEEQFMQSIRLKENDSSDYKKYLPNQIYGYSLEGKETYKSCLIQLPFQKDTSKQYKFLKQIVAGPSELYEYKANTTQYQYYFRNETGNMYKLTYEPKIVNSFGDEAETGTINEDYTYIGLLKFLMRSQPSLVQKIENTTYHKEDLGKLVEKYNFLIVPDYSGGIANNDSVNRNLKYFAKKFSYYIECSYYKNEFENTSRAEYPKYIFKTNYFNFTAKIGLPVKHTSELRIGVGYFKNTYDDSIPHRYSVGQFDLIEINISNLQFVFEYKYVFLLNKIQPYASAGISVIYLSQDNTRIYSVIGKEETFKYKFHHGLGYQLSMGVVKKQNKFDLYGGIRLQKFDYYELINSIVEMTDYGFFLGIGF